MLITTVASISKLNLENEYLIAIGKNATSMMPQTTVFNYSGTGFSLFDTNNNGMIDSQTLTQAKFTADFGNKTLTGQITGVMEGFSPVNLSADITKNTFTGYQNGVYVQGGFFGYNASELAGDYESLSDDKQRSLGVFRATRE